MYISKEKYIVFPCSLSPSFASEIAFLIKEKMYVLCRKEKEVISINYLYKVWIRLHFIYAIVN